MSFLFPFPIDTSKIIVVDSETSPMLPKAVISPYIATPITGSVLAITPNSNVTTYFTTPLLPEYNLNYNPEVHENVSNSIYRKVFESWIYKSDFEDLFKYIKIVNGEPKLVSSLKDTDKSDDSYSIERKIRLMKDHILSRGRVKKILEEFTAGTKTNWYDIEKNSYFVKDLIYRYMKKKLKTLVEMKRN
jgi:hypothetical protein